MLGCLSAGLTSRVKIPRPPEDQTVSAKRLAAATEQGAGVAGHTGSRHRVSPQEQLESAYLSSRASPFLGFETGGLSYQDHQSKAND